MFKVEGSRLKVEGSRFKVQGSRLGCVFNMASPLSVTLF